VLDKPTTIFDNLHQKAKEETTRNMVIQVLNDLLGQARTRLGPRLEHGEDIGCDSGGQKMAVKRRSSNTPGGLGSTHSRACLVFFTTLSDSKGRYKSDGRKIVVAPKRKARHQVGLYRSGVDEGLLSSESMASI
jgi:hypothetical protein